jgi:hypothetical protein
MAHIVSELSPKPATELLASDVAVGEAKTFTVSTILGTKRKYMRLFHVKIAYTATVTVGTRTLRVRVMNGATVIVSRVLRAETNLTASQIKRIAVLFALPYETDGAEFVDLPVNNDPQMLLPGYTVEVADTAAVDVLDTCAAALRGRRGT